MPRNARIGGCPSGKPAEAGCCVRSSSRNSSVRSRSSPRIPLADRKVANALNGLVIHPVVDEGSQQAVATPYPDRAVPRPRQGQCGTDDPVQRRVQLQVGADLDRQLEQQAHLVAVGGQLVELIMNPAHIPPRPLPTELQTTPTFADQPPRPPPRCAGATHRIVTVRSCPRQARAHAFQQKSDVGACCYR